MYTYFRLCEPTVVNTHKSPELRRPPDMPAEASAVSFRLSTLLVFVTACAAWSGILCYSPQPAILIAIGVVPACVTVGIMHVRRRLHGRQFRQVERWTWLTIATVAWLGLYILSYGPVVAFAMNGEIDSDAGRFWYAPIWWLHDETPLEGMAVANLKRNW